MLHARVELVCWGTVGRGLVASGGLYVEHGVAGLCCKGTVSVSAGRAAGAAASGTTAMRMRGLSGQPQTTNCGAPAWQARNTVHRCCEGADPARPRATPPRPLPLGPYPPSCTHLEQAGLHPPQPHEVVAPVHGGADNHLQDSGGGGNN